MITDMSALIEWVRTNPEKVAKIVEAERRIDTGRVEIHYHEGVAKVVRVVYPERRETVDEPD